MLGSLIQQIYSTLFFPPSFPPISASPLLLSFPLLPFAFSVSESNCCYHPIFSDKLRYFKNLWPLFFYLSCQIIWKHRLGNIFNAKSLVSKLPEPVVRQQLLNAVGVCSVYERERASIHLFWTFCFEELKVSTRSRTRILSSEAVMLMWQLHVIYNGTWPIIALWI